jgi:hypothetical protein
VRTREPKRAGVRAASPPRGRGTARARQSSRRRTAHAAARTASRRRRRRDRPAKPAHRAPSHPPLHDVEAHGATRDQIVSVIRPLSGSDPTRWINLDVLEKALKTRASRGRRARRGW